MSIQLGDKVSFLNEDLDGTVTKIIDNKLVEVTTNDGFGIPVLIKELVKKSGNSGGVHAVSYTHLTLPTKRIV